MSKENENLKENIKVTEKKPTIWKEFKTKNPITAKTLKVAAVSTGVAVGSGIVFATGGATAGFVGGVWIVLNVAVPTTTLATVGTAGIVCAGIGGKLLGLGLVLLKVLKLGKKKQKE